MHIKNYILLVLALVFVACSTEKSEGESIVQQPVELVIRASQGGTSRTEMGDVGDGAANSFQTINWAEGDKIKIWAKMTEANASFVINGTTFQLSTFNSTYNSADFKAWAGQMSEGTYNYYGVYPEPESIIGETTVVYTIPSTQSGAYNPALDVMVANTTGRELAYRTDMNPTIGYPEEPRLSFEHLFHLIRIRVPENKLGGAIKFLTIIFPNDVVGKVSFDVSKLTDSNFDITNSQYATWSEMSNKVSIELPDEDLLNANGRYVWLHIKPGALSGNLRMRACSNEGVISQEVVVANFSKTMEAGHITPMALTVPASDETAYKEITFRCLDDEQYPNFLGEAATKMYVRAWPTTKKPIKAQSSEISSEGSGIFKAKFYYLNDGDYKFNTNTNEAKMNVAFDSAHASISDIEYSLELRDFETYSESYYALPYLFFEDFVNMNSDCSTGDDYDTNISGVSLNSKYFNPIQTGKYGWTGSNVTGESGMITIKAKSDRYIGSYAYYRGRLDSSQMPLLGSTSVSVSFDFKCSAGTIFTPNMTYGQTTDANPIQAHTYRIVAINYNYGNKVSGTQKTLTANQTGKQTYSISGCTGSHRLSWDVFGSGGSGQNTEYISLTIDNIKVSIGSEAKHTNLNYRDYFPNHTN